MGDSDFGIEDELSPIDDLAMEFDMAKLNQYADGGEADDDDDDDYANGGGVNNKIKIKGFPPISKEEALLMKEDFEQNFSSNIEKYTKHLNRVHNSKLRVIDVKEVIDFANTYADGGEVEDWMEKALASLIEETGNEDLEITYVVDSKIKYEFIASDGDVEYRVFITEGDAEEIAVEQVRDDLQESP